MANRGLFVALEGVDGVGKSTICRLVVDTLVRQGLSAVATELPPRGEGDLGRIAFRAKHAPESLGVQGVTQGGLQLLFAAAHLDGYLSRIVPLLQAGQIVVAARSVWTMVAYGLCGGIPEVVMDSILCTLSAAGHPLTPDITVHLKGRWAPDLLDAERRCLEKRYDRLAESARLDGRLVVTIRNTGTIDDVVQKVVMSVHQYR